jgi:predicted transcriptional regulator
MEKYKKNIEEKIKLFYDNLSEKDKRYYAGIEAIKLGHGGIQYISALLGCSRQTVSKGLEDIKNKSLLGRNHVRNSGGGRKSYEKKYSDVNSIFFESD